MNLEQLIERAQTEIKLLEVARTERWSSVHIYDHEMTLAKFKRELADFILAHADEFITFERQHFVRTSILDDNQ